MREGQEAQRERQEAERESEGQETESERQKRETHSVGAQTQVVGAEVLHHAHLASRVVHVEEAGSRVVAQHLVENAAL